MAARPTEDKPGHRKFASYDLPDWVRHPLKPQTLKVALLFPGEQPLAPGLLAGVRRKPVVRRLLEAATQVLEFDVEELMLVGPASRMRQPRFNQALMYVADCAAYEVLREKDPDTAERCQAVAGLGVGELAALYAAGVVTFEQGLELVRARGEALEEIAATVEIDALVVRGVDRDRLDRNIKTVQKQDAEGGQGKPEVHVVRHWCPDGYVCIGTRGVVRRLKEVVERDAAADTDVRMLPDPPHAGYSPLAAAAGERVAALLTRLAPSMRAPRCDLFLNCIGRRVAARRPPQFFLEVLQRQLTEPVQWQACVTQMLNWGIREFYECGPNRSLKFAMGFVEHFVEAPAELVRPADFTWNVSV